MATEAEMAYAEGYAMRSEELQQLDAELARLRRIEQAALRIMAYPVPDDAEYRELAEALAARGGGRDG